MVACNPPDMCQRTCGVDTTAEDKKCNKPSKLYISFRNNYPQKNAAILSGQYGINFFIVGLLLMILLATHKGGVKTKHLCAYLITLMAVQLVWMIWYVIRKHRLRKLKREKDVHAGAWWLKCGLTLFAVLVLILDAFKIGYFVGYSACLSAAEGVYPVAHAIHTLAQLYFLWFHAKDVIHSFKTFERFGTIHAVFTNLLLWANGVLSESEHQLEEYKKRLSNLGFTNVTVGTKDPYCNCTTSACSVFAKGYYYLYPFYIEYHIFVSVMLLVMWKNIGRTLEHHSGRKHTFKPHGILSGFITGLIALAITVGIVIVYIIQVNHSPNKKDLAVTMIYSFGITLMSLMAIAEVIGLMIYRIDVRSLDYSKNPTRKLDAELLIISACGTWLLSWSSILAVICATSHPSYSWLSLPYSLISIIENYVQNTFIIESVHREHHEDKEDIQFTQGIFSVSNTRSISIASSYGVCNEAFDNKTEDLPNMIGGSTDIPSDEKDNNIPDSSAATLPVGEIVLSAQKKSKLGKKRTILKNIAVALLLSNISLWILPAFGCRPQYDSGLEEAVYGFENWVSIVNIAMPFAIFYRMHSAALLFEVYCIT
ncbi:proton channel OTOP1-like [Protopterus annectens]|uniref:proton channel OTOP1-like n=1 Tax=Protopterus annectens TaxID=7888 RepID=UPI001CF98C7C|nr:proton channel OTOP1-like [Protopterus annectens]XP_043918533.1 proton channel OTOP1-like [Protopterus annectens]XP_043918534.1 proton channel OTOP1-like [Protopterus annectens]